MGLLRYVILIFVSLTTVVTSAQEEEQYERSSLHTMLISHRDQAYEDNIAEVFNDIPFPERFNNHNLGVNKITFFGTEKDPSTDIMRFCQEVKLGQKMVAKWFNRKKSTGSMDMKLVKERGCYNATQAQTNVARASLRGLSLLADAGESLIKNTYLLVSDIKYKGVGSHGLGIGSIFLSKKVREQLDEMSAGVGFIVEVTSYLFRLKWDDSMTEDFYTKYYTENGPAHRDKVEAFMRDGDRWQMEYVGKTFCSSKKKNSKEAISYPRRLLTKVTTRALDKNLAQLQHEHPDFRIKATLVSTEPLKAYVGLKEDITPKSRFEVLERVIDKDGRLSYKRVGIIKPKAGRPIWDNRYMADDEDADSKLGYTEFEQVSGRDFCAGMLIRETND